MLLTILANTYWVWWVAQLIALAILIALFLRWRPKFLGRRTIGQMLSEALNSRAASIQEQLQAAERSRAEAARIREEAALEVTRAREQAQEIVARAEQTS